jgi:HSP20 family protein
MARLERRSERAPLTRWDPFAELESLHDQMGRLLTGRLADWPNAVGVWTPAVDLEETDDAYVVEAELPGVAKNDLNVEFHDGELVITGDVKEKERAGVLHRRTRRTGHFEYRAALPKDVDADKVDARLADGVLTVRVPKTAKSAPKRIAISS